MTVIKRKTKKAITKQVKKLVKKHGPEIALGMATALVGTIVASATGKEKKGTKSKSGNAKPVTKRKSEVRTSKVMSAKKARKKVPKKSPTKVDG